MIGQRMTGRWHKNEQGTRMTEGRLAQLVRALPSHGRGHWFESSAAQ